MWSEERTSDSGFLRRLVKTVFADIVGNRRVQHFGHVEAGRQSVSYVGAADGHKRSWDDILPQFFYACAAPGSCESGKVGRDAAGPGVPGIRYGIPWHPSRCSDLRACGRVDEGGFSCHRRANPTRRRVVCRPFILKETISLMMVAASSRSAQIGCRLDLGRRLADGPFFLRFWQRLKWGRSIRPRRDKAAALQAGSPQAARPAFQGRRRGGRSLPRARSAARPCKARG